MRADGRSEPSAWQSDVLQAMLRSNGVCLCVIPLVAAAIGGTMRPLHWFVEGVGVVSLLLTRTSSRMWRVVAIAYLSLLFLVALTTGYYHAWSPGVVAMLCYLSVAAGILFGRWGVIPLALVTAVILQTGGWMVLTGRFSVPLLPLLDPRDPINWLRLSLVFLMIVGASAWLIRYVMAATTRAEEAAIAALREAREQLVAATRVRADRLTQESAVRHSQRLQMVAHLGEGFAHLLNNMLTVVRSVCDDLRTPRSQATIRQAARDMREVVRECAKRTHEMLVMSRTQEESFTALEIDQALILEFAQATEKLRSNIRCELVAGPCGSVHLPRLWLEQILTNLLLNAEQAMPHGGHIRVETSTIVVEQPLWSTVDELRPGRYAVLSVSDDGCGMTAEVMERAFEPFFSTHSAATHAGLGLTLVLGMAKQVGGSVELSRLDKGTRVSVFLACAKHGDHLPRTVTLEQRGGAQAAPEPLPWARTSRSSAAVLPQNAAIDSSQVRPEAGSAASALPAAGPPSVSPIQQRSVTNALNTPANDDVSTFAWRERGLNQIIRVMGALVMLMALVGVRLGDRWMALVYLLMGVGMTTLSWLPRASYRIRLWAFLMTFVGLVSSSIVNRSYLTPGPMAGLAAAAYFAAIYGGRRTVVGTLTMTSLFLAGGAFRWSRDPPDDYLAGMLGDNAGNWFRIGVTLPLVIAGIAVAVVRVFSNARARASELKHACRELEHSHAVYQTETTALLQSEETRSRAARMEVGGLLTGMLAHDLNNCLGAMLGWAEILELSATPQEITEGVTTITRSADYAEALVQQLQHNTSIDHRDSSLDLAAAIHRMGPMLVALAGKSPREVAVEIDAESAAFVAINEHSLRRLVLNLVANARDACVDRGGSCTIRVKRESSTVVLETSDDGCGMDEPTRQRLFEAFFTTKGAHGTGLGLHSVMEIVAGTGGSIDVWSEPGVGTRFTIRWSLAAPPSITSDASNAALSKRGKARVLLVEDHATIRRVMARGLDHAGYVVSDAADGDEAMKALADDAFDLLCTDAVMPGQSVESVIEHFRELHPHSPIFVVSGYLPEGVLAKMQADERIRILFKPLTTQRLISAFESALGSSPS